MAEDVFNEHFPGYPIVPASLLLEGLAQTGGILVGEANDFREKVILAKIPKAQFHLDALAGQELVYEAKLVQFRNEGEIGGRHDSRCRLAIGRSGNLFRHLDQARSQQIFGDRNLCFPAS